MEASAASTSSLLVRIVKNELTAKFIFHIAHLSADQCHDCLAINDHFYSCFFDHFIKLLDLLLSDVVHRVGKTITALLCKTDLKSDLNKKVDTKF